MTRVLARPAKAAKRRPGRPRARPCRGGGQAAQAGRFHLESCCMALRVETADFLAFPDHYKLLHATRVQHDVPDVFVDGPVAIPAAIGLAVMSDFIVKIEDWQATASHRASGHVFQFSIAPDAPHLRGGAVRENPRADRAPDSLWPSVREAVLSEARAAGLIPK